MSTDNEVKALVVEPAGKAYTDGGCAFPAIQQIEAGLGIKSGTATRSTIQWGGAYQTGEAESAIHYTIRGQQPDVIVLIAFEPGDSEERLIRNAVRLSKFVPFGFDDDLSWPRPVHAFYITEGNGDEMKWRQVYPKPKED